MNVSKIFSKEIFQSKKYLILLFIIFTYIFLFVSFVMINNKNKIDCLEQRDIEIYGKVIKPFNYAFYNPLKTNEWFDLDSSIDSITVYNLVYRNIITCSDPKTLQKIEYKVIGCTKKFAETELSKRLIKGRLPVLGKDEVVIGKDIADLYELSINDEFNSTIKAKEPYQYLGLSASINEDFEDLSNYKVVGIIKDTIQDYNCSVFNVKNDKVILEKSNKIDVILNKDISVKKYKSIVKELKDSGQNYIGSIESNYLTRYKQKRKNIFNLSVCLICTFIMVYCMINSIFKNDTNKIGVLRALGIKKKTITGYYLSVLIKIELLGFVVAILGTILYLYKKNKSLVTMFGTTEAPYVLQVKTILFLIITFFVFIVLVSSIVTIKVRKNNINKLLQAK